MRHHHQTPNRFSPLGSLCLLILLSESCHHAASVSLDESKADLTSDFEERPVPAFKRASSYVRFGKRSNSIDSQQEDAGAQPMLPKLRRSNPGSMERASRASGYVRFGKRGGPPSRSNMIHDSQMDYSEGSDGFLPPRPLPCTPDYLLTLATFEEKYEHIRQCTGARRNHLGMRRPTRSRESGYVRYG